VTRQRTFVRPETWTGHWTGVGKSPRHRERYDRMEGGQVAGRSRCDAPSPTGTPPVRETVGNGRAKRDFRGFFRGFGSFRRRDDRRTGSGLWGADASPSNSTKIAQHCDGTVRAHGFRTSRTERHVRRGDRSIFPRGGTYASGETAGRSPTAISRPYR